RSHQGPPLFPYTTLFRSEEGWHEDRVAFGRKSLGHSVHGRPNAEGIHVDDYAGFRTIAAARKQMGRRHPILRADRNLLRGHSSLLGWKESLYRAIAGAQILSRPAREMRCARLPCR